jgi:hypothetical protein
MGYVMSWMAIIFFFQMAVVIPIADYLKTNSKPQTRGQSQHYRVIVLCPNDQKDGLFFGLFCSFRVGHIATNILDHDDLVGADILIESPENVLDACKGHKHIDFPSAEFLVVADPDNMSRIESFRVSNILLNYSI